MTSECDNCGLTSEEKAERIRENLADAKHPDEYEDDADKWERGGRRVAYAAQLLWRAGRGHPVVAEALAEFNDHDNASNQIADSITVQDAVDAAAPPETASKLSDLHLSGATYIRACRYADAALHGVGDDD